jgi:hypothetical protein
LNPLSEKSPGVTRQKKKILGTPLIRLMWDGNIKMIIKAAECEDVKQVVHILTTTLTVKLANGYFPHYNLPTLPTSLTIMYGLQWRMQHQIMGIKSTSDALVRFALRETRSIFVGFP